MLFRTNQALNVYINVFCILLHIMFEIEVLLPCVYWCKSPVYMATAAFLQTQL